MNPRASETQIKAATVDDLPAIRDLAGVIWRAYYPAVVTREQIEYMLGRMYDLNTLRDEVQTQSIRFDRMFLADALVGFAAYGPLPEPGTWKLHKLYLLPEHHGCGLGSQLLRHCEAQSRALGAHRMLLNVNKRNTRALAAYQRNGWVVAESVCVDIGSGFVMDDFVMSKKLA